MELGWNILPERSNRTIFLTHGHARVCGRVGQHLHFLKEQQQQQQQKEIAMPNPFCLTFNVASTTKTTGVASTCLEFAFGIFRAANPHEGHPSGKDPIRVPSLLSGSGYTLDGFMLLQLGLAWQQL